MSNRIIKNYTYTRLDDINNQAITTSIANGKVISVIQECRFKYEKSISKK